MKRIIQTSLLSGLVLSTGVAMAQPQRGGRGGRQAMQSPAENMMRMFDEADADGDGNLTKEEFQKAVEKQMANQRGMQQRGRPGFGGPRGVQGSGGGPAGMRGPGGPEGFGPPPHGERPEGRPPYGEEEGDVHARPEGHGPGGRGPEGHGPEGHGEHAEGEHGEHRGPGGHGGPPPGHRPGEIIPERVAEHLSLTDEQKEKLAALQKEVDKQIAALLTDEQKEKLENPPEHEGRPPHGEGRPPHDEERGSDRSGRPQRPSK